MNKNLLILFLRAKLTKKGFTIKKDIQPDFIDINSNLQDIYIRVGINLCDNKVTVHSTSEQYSIRYGEMDIDKFCQQLKEKEKKYLEFIDKIKSYISMDENDMKRYLIEHIEEVQFENEEFLY